jgi:nitrate/nitrite-specific signal transduction histidine kinase
MRERAEALGGSFTLASTPGGGTTVVFEVPIREHDAAMDAADAAGGAFVTPA